MWWLVLFRFFFWYTAEIVSASIIRVGPTLLLQQILTAKFMFVCLIDFLLLNFFFSKF